MNAEADMQRCLTFINCQLQPARPFEKSPPSPRPWRAVTISRQTGCGAHLVAEQLAKFLVAHSAEGAPGWEVFDRNLVEKVLADHHLPGRLASFMPEDRISEVADTMEELFGLHPPTWILTRKTAETILHLAELGNTILIGRGASVITRNLPDVFHVRLVAALEQRVATIQQLRQLGPKDARVVTRQEDRGRRAYLAKYLGRDIDDPLLYHLVINTSLIRPEDAAAIIGHAMRTTLPVVGNESVPG
jgi:cytidylate kinase